MNRRRLLNALELQSAMAPMIAAPADKGPPSSARAACEEWQHVHEKSKHATPIELRHMKRCAPLLMLSTQNPDSVRHVYAFRCYRRSLLHFILKLPQLMLQWPRQVQLVNKPLADLHPNAQVSADKRHPQEELFEPVPAISTAQGSIERYACLSVGRRSSRIKTNILRICES